jgi:hypothetical protein
MGENTFYLFIHYQVLKIERKPTARRGGASNWAIAPEHISLTNRNIGLQIWPIRAKVWRIPLQQILSPRFVGPLGQHCHLHKKL